MGKSSRLAEKSKNKFRKHQESEREKAGDDAVVEISMNDVLNLRPEDAEQAGPPSVSKAKGKAGAVVQACSNSDEGSDINSEVEEQERRITEKKKKRKGKGKDQGTVMPFSQRDLVSLAFAGDKVVQVCFFPEFLVKTGYFYLRSQDFQEAKQREILDDAPKEVDTTLPGWVQPFSHSAKLSGILNFKSL